MPISMSLRESNGRRGKEISLIGNGSIKQKSRKDQKRREKTRKDDKKQ